MAKQDEQHTPLSDSVYYIMISLVEPMHGYAVMQHVEEISGGEVKIGPATLYTSLTRLQEGKLIEARDDIPQSDERRKPYALTQKGLTVLKQETMRRETMVRHGRQAVAQMEENDEYTRQ